MHFAVYDFVWVTSGNKHTLRYMICNMYNLIIIFKPPNLEESRELRVQHRYSRGIIFLVKMDSPGSKIHKIVDICMALVRGSVFGIGPKNDNATILH